MLVFISKFTDSCQKNTIAPREIRGDLKFNRARCTLPFMSSAPLELSRQIAACVIASAWIKPETVVTDTREILGS